MDRELAREEIYIYLQRGRERKRDLLGEKSESNRERREVKRREDTFKGKTGNGVQGELGR